MQLVASSDTFLATESAQEDDIDQAFQRLRKLEPSTNLMQQIWARIDQLPTSQRYSRTHLQDDAEQETAENEISLQVSEASS